MADLGPTEPIVDWVVVCSVVAIAVAAMSVGLASTIIRLLREPVAATLSEASP